MISVIIPVYNGEAVIGRCLRSVLSQTYSDYEVLVIDDGSKDHTAQEVLSLADYRIRLIQQENAGVSAARNRGIDEAGGKYLVFVDADDYVEPTYLQTLLSLYEEGTLPVVGFMKNHTGRTVLPNRIPGGYQVGALMPRDYLTGDLGRSIAYSCWNKLFSRQVLQEYHLRFSEELKLGEDLVFVFRYLCYCSRVVYNEQALYHYCDTSGSAIHRCKDQSKEYGATLEILQSLCQNGYYFEQASLASWCLEIMTYILQNSYVTAMGYTDFCSYVQKMKTDRIGILSVGALSPRGLTRSVFWWALRRRSPIWLFLLIQVNCRLK